MNQIILKIPRKKQKLRIIRNEEIIRSEFDRKVKEIEQKLLQEKLSELEKLIVPEPEIEIIEEVVPEPKQTIYTEVFTISDSNQPIEISLSNIPEESVPLEEAKSQIQAAYDKGFEEGQDSLRATFEAEIDLHQRWIKRFDELSRELRSQFRNEIIKLQSSVIPLSITIANHILTYESQTSLIVVDQVKKAIGELDNEEIMKIIINPADFNVLDQIKSELIEDKDLIKNMSIVPDDSIEKGSCMLITAAGTIDARFSVQLERLKKILVEADIKESDDSFPKLPKSEGNIGSIEIDSSKSINDYMDEL